MKLYRGIFLKNENELALMHEANRIGLQILDAMSAAVKPGVSTMHFEDIAQAMCKEFGVRPAFQGYHGYPYALCCSVNEEIVHGFPSAKRILQEGDIVSFDMGVVYQGFFGDAARTVAVGTISPDAEKLVSVTRECLMRAVEAVKPGNNLYAVSRAVQSHAEANGFGVVRQFVGHGIGRSLHEKPEVPNFVPVLPSTLQLKTGMVLAIEPMVVQGSYEVDILSDEWTAVTRDRKLAAHFEYSVAVTAQGAVILGLE